MDQKTLESLLRALGWEPGEILYRDPDVKLGTWWGHPEWVEQVIVAEESMIDYPRRTAEVLAILAEVHKCPSVSHLQGQWLLDHAGLK